MAITLNDFRALANGDYNAGQIDFKTNSNGETTGLKKVNHHVTFRSLNTVEISTQRSLRAAVLSGSTDLDKLRQDLAKAVDNLEFAVIAGVQSIDLALNDVALAKPLDRTDFETSTAAEIFADIVDTNIDSVKKSFSNLLDKGKLVRAFNKAGKDNVNHQHDGHKKVRTNKL